MIRRRLTLAVLGVLACGLARGDELKLALATDHWDTTDVYDGITVRTRETPGTPVRQVWAEGTLEGSVPELKDVLADAEHLAQFMPYVKVSRILKKESDAEVVYTEIDPPVVGQRDYIVRSHVIEDAPEVFRNSWTALPDYLPRRKYVERIVINDGYWYVRTATAGHVLLQHSFRTDPGGLIPSAFVNLANRRGITDLDHAVQTEVLRRRTAREQAAAAPAHRESTGGASAASPGQP